MKKYVLLSILLTFVTCAFSQNYDLIVCTNNDSIACFIDSISGNQIFFRMKIKDYWRQTYIGLEEITEYKYAVIDRYNVKFEPGSSKIKRMLPKPVIDNPEDLFDHRYFFSPSAFPIKKKEWYYTTTFALIHDFHYGINDKLGLRVGTSTFLFPYYVMGQYTVFSKKKTTIAFGDLFVFLPLDDGGMYGNLAFGLTTFGTQKSNISLGAGLWSTNTNEISWKGNYPAVTFSFQGKLSEYAYFVSENILFNMDQEHTASKYDNDPDNPIAEEDFPTESTTFFGTTGFRFIAKKSKRPQCWQFGVFYLYTSSAQYPAKYLTSYWDEPNPEESFDFGFALPYISYSLKF